MEGYDIDGTLTPPSPRRAKSIFKQTGEERRAFNKERAFHYRHAKLLLKPDEPYALITGRSEKYRDVTEAWMADNGLNPVGLYMLRESRNKENMIRHKLKTCLELGITVFYEDDEDIASALSKAGISVVLMGSRNGK
jgi:uncharacterized HAD superfamily protein